jgi:hypothetical protein
MLVTIGVMATTARVSDVENLAMAVLGHGTPEGAVAYRPDHTLFSVLQGDDEFDELTVQIYGETSGLGETLAALDAVQLAFDVAAVAVGYRLRYADDYEQSGEAEEREIRSRLRLLLREPMWRLEIIELSSPGSFRAKLKGPVDDADVRKKLLAVAALAASIVPAIVAPPIGAPAAVVALLGVGDAFLTKKLPKEVLIGRLEEQQAAAAQREGFANEDWDRAIRSVFDSGFDELTAYLEQQRLESLAREEAMNARIQKLEFELQARGGDLAATKRQQP